MKKEGIISAQQDSDDLAKFEAELGIKEKKFTKRHE